MLIGISSQKRNKNKSINILDLRSADVIQVRQKSGERLMLIRRLIRLARYGALHQHKTKQHIK